MDKKSRLVPISEGTNHLDNNGRLTVTTAEGTETYTLPRGPKLKPPPIPQKWIEVFHKGTPNCDKLPHRWEREEYHLRCKTCGALANASWLTEERGLDEACVATADDGRQFLCPDEDEAQDALEARGLKGTVDPASAWRVPKEFCGTWRYRPTTKTHWRDWPDWDNDIPEHKDWFQDADEFLAKPAPERKMFLSQDGTPIMGEKMLIELYAYRGVGKSLFSNMLIKLFIHGGKWLRFSSPGGLTVALIDAELPAPDLHKRLTDTVGDSDGRLLLMSPEFMGKFPTLSDPANQDKLLEQLAELQPDVVILDSLTAGFRTDTNDPEANNRMNDFLLRLRSAGYCFVFVHHAGKTGLQRGRSDIEDHADLVIKLSPADDAEMGELRVKLEYEKKRSAGVVEGFSFANVKGVWIELQDPTDEKIAQMLRVGKSWRSIKTSLEVGNSRIARVARKLEAASCGVVPDREQKEKMGVPVNDEEISLS